mmetsp:Transcript_16657/g.24399  ORF Transcript_16657/g.24399 Transcript_16657/m.24399 type:complete len:332 (-) Transcript_16657:189-1184(-)|eukprot:CAMPEP_0194094712 /NCGR_PEP_ID=MMETSP0149-20130528/55223_1 /TAXON_ID=122233 /ORGANISM="Chaetoceros debilis, Strain MM31A-1" /LENGTH=331 /DNA_ID=CAMNT_0038780501 /DNA_START=40 /DNA_END=1035 /DNA_ORIENTATION=-
MKVAIFCASFLWCWWSSKLAVVEAASATGQDTLIGIVGRNYILLGADSSLASSITLTSKNVDKIKIISNPFPNDRKKCDSFSNVDSCGNNKSDSCDGREQQIIAVAASGNVPDSERLVGTLTARVAQIEYEGGMGCDVKCIFDGSYYHKVNSNDEVRTNHITRRSSNTILHANSVAFLARGQISDALRSRNRMSTSLLIGGLVPHSKGDGGSEVESSSAYFKPLRIQVDAATGVKCKERNEATLLDNSSLKPTLFWLDEYGSLQQIEYGVHGLGSNFILSILDRKYQEDLPREDGIRLIQDCFEQLRNRYAVNSPEKPCIKCIDRDGCCLV